MAMTGVAVDPACKTTFEEMKLKHTHRYIVFVIEGNKTIKIEKIGAKEEKYEDFVKCLPEAEPRYGVCDIEFETDDGRPQSKIAFFLWAPDNGKVKDKMLYASSKDAIKKVLSGFSKEIQANDSSDMDYENINQTMKK